MFTMPTTVIKKKWPQVEETTSKPERSEGIRSFKIQGQHSSWEIKGIKSNAGIIFKIDNYSKYIFNLKDDVLTGKKVAVERVSDSGILSCHEGRFNLVNDNGEGKTVRLVKLIEYLPKVFEDSIIKDFIKNN
jgi:hypothetical protein